jgi:DNA polymerase-3 subunit epsilon
MSGITDFIALDVETANADFGSICAIGLVHFRSAEVFKSLMILVDPEDDFDPVNIGIHGIRPGDVVGNAYAALALNFSEFSATTTPISARSSFRANKDVTGRWGAPRIHGELLKLGFEVAQSLRFRGAARTNLRD